MTAGSKPPLVTAASVTRESIAVGLLGKKKVDAPAAVGGGEEGGEWRDGLLATLLRPLHEARPRRPSADEADPRNLAPHPSEAGAGGEPGGEAAADAAESLTRAAGEAGGHAGDTAGDKAGDEEGDAGDDGVSTADRDGGDGGDGEGGDGNQPPMVLVFDGDLEPPVCEALGGMAA